MARLIVKSLAGSFAKDLECDAHSRERCLKATAIRFFPEWHWLSATISIAALPFSCKDSRARQQTKAWWLRHLLCSHIKNPWQIKAKHGWSGIYILQGDF
jgi:hypothetical protein